MINLQKSQTVNMSAAQPGLAQLHCGLGWDITPGIEADLDVSAFMLNDANKIPGDSFLIFYNNLIANGVTHMGDNRTGEGEGDDEVVKINLLAVPQEVTQILLVVTCATEGVDLSSVSNAFVRVVDDGNGTPLLNFSVSAVGPGMDSLQIGRVFRSGNEWEFEALGIPFSGGLEACVGMYS
jgi:tellurium resistance protein TerD